MRSQPGFARIAHAFSGLTHLAGLPGGVPVVPGSTSLADYMSGMYGAIGALVALQARQATGEGQCIDLALYESVFRVLDEIAPAFQKFGYVRERMGADTVNVCPHSHYQTRDGKWIAIACTSDAMFARLAEAMEQPELASAEQYGPKDLRLGARDEVNAIVAKWVASLDLETVLKRCAAGGVPASLIYSIADIFEDPQYRARGNIKMTASRAGAIAVPDVVPRLSATPGEIRWLGEGIGAQNEEIFRDLLGLKDNDLRQMRDEGVI
jgi:crotonobetainyl-CoA:carnitine CoA-transferase CaiB-like acyl-CoA transferase